MFMWRNKGVWKKWRRGWHEPVPTVVTWLVPKEATWTVILRMEQTAVLVDLQSKLKGLTWHSAFLFYIIKQQVSDGVFIMFIWPTGLNVDLCWTILGLLSFVSVWILLYADCLFHLVLFVMSTNQPIRSFSAVSCLVISLCILVPFSIVWGLLLGIILVCFPRCGVYPLNKAKVESEQNYSLKSCYLTILYLEIW